MITVPGQTQGMTNQTLTVPVCPEPRDHCGKPRRGERDLPARARVTHQRLKSGFGFKNDIERCLRRPAHRRESALINYNLSQSPFPCLGAERRAISSQRDWHAYERRCTIVESTDRIKVPFCSDAAPGSPASHPSSRYGTQANYSHRQPNKGR